MLRNLALAAAATLVGLLCAELAYRGYEAAFPPPASPTSAALLDPELAALPELRGLLALARPDTRGRFMNVLWRTNSAGMRGPEPGPPDGSFRIALLGDSVAAGVGVPEEEIYASQLARLLAESGGGARFEVLNFALPGLSAPGVVARGAQLALRYPPRLFVYGYTLNDLFEPGEEKVAAPAERVDFASLEALAESVRGLRSRLLPALITRLIAINATIRPNAYTRLVQQSYADPEMQARLGRSFAELAALAARHGVCAHVFVHTDLAALRFGHPFADVYAQVADVARASGLSASTSYPAFRGRDSTWLRLSPMDGHPNARGHALLAASLYDALRALPPRCGLPALRARGEE